MRQGSPTNDPQLSEEWMTGPIYKRISDQMRRHLYRPLHIIHNGLPVSLREAIDPHNLIT